MQIKIDLSRIQSLPDLPSHYDEGQDDVRSILSDLCEALADSASADFVISGFGQDRWPADVRTDLPVLLEQLPGAIASIDSGTAFTLDFYEQGIERTIHFEPQNGRYSAHCESRTKWRPDPGIETIDRMELQQMFSDARASVMEFLARVSPRIAAHPWLHAWAMTRSDQPRGKQKSRG